MEAQATQTINLLLVDDHAMFREGLARVLEKEPVRPRPLLTGDDVMAELSLPPGPLIGRILAAVGRAHAEGRVQTRAQGLALARRIAGG